MLADDVVKNSSVIQQDSIQTLQSQFDIAQGNDMLFLAMQDMPPVPVNETGLIAAAPSSALKTMNYGICQFIQAWDEHTAYDKGFNVQLHPQYLAIEVLPKKLREGFHNSSSDYDETTLVSDWIDQVVIKRLSEPEHGSMLDIDQYKDRYVPNKGYIGKDQVDFLLEGKDLDGQPFSMKVKYYINVMPKSQLDNVIKNAKSSQQAMQKYCVSSTATWRISDNASSSIVGFSGYDSLPTVTFTDLTGAAVGETNGAGADATITLDTDAAGHGWFIDYTPYLNEEFLPTSNPNEWVAKAGSSAAGKMDMLSVLLHEYGHALGLEHSVDGHNFMGTTLTPVMRRLPSAEELTLMAQLVAEAKQNLSRSDSNVAVGNATDPTPSPIPALPLGAGFGISFLGLTRRNTNSASNLFGEGASDNAPVQYAIAANPTLTNGDFTTTDGWETTGKVDVNNGAAVLSEVATSQTRLNQVFVLGEHDRFLSFTLANLTLGDQAEGPDDAFEAALLDANTGLSLLGATGLSRNDAFLNLQANGEEHKASGITRIDNADGSRTYLVDLGGIAAGTDDANAAAQLSMTTPIRTFDEMLRTESKDYAGDALYNKIIDDAVAEMKFVRTVNMPGGCFVAGTLVHTKEGLKPIEQIKVGDWVLSKPEMGEGEQAYKRVVKTVSFEDKEVWTVSYILKSELDEALLEKRMMREDCESRLIVTPNHPFWVKGKGWTQAKDLHELHNDELELENGQSALLARVALLYRSASEGVAWLEGEFEPDNGRLIDLRNGQSGEFDYSKQRVYESTADFDDSSTYFRTTVYNLEVEDFHTYYVGTKGIWVHNTSPFKVSP